MHAKTLGLLVLVVGIGAVAPSAAMAQFGGQYMGRSDNPVGPTVSPYLNLLQNDNIFSPATNYQSLVKPLIDQNRAIGQQGYQLNRLQQQVNTQGATGNTAGRGTGHTTFFMNYLHYYPSATQR